MPPMAFTNGLSPMCHRRTGPVNARLSREAAEAWLTRRIDEVYRELTREPLDDTLEDDRDGKAQSPEP